MAEITIHVAFMGPVKRPVDANEMSVSLDEGATIVDLLTSLGYIRTQARHLGVFRDGHRLPHSTPLVDGESITVALAVGGG